MKTPRVLRLNADDNVWKTQGGSAYVCAVTGSAT